MPSNKPFNRKRGGATTSQSLSQSRLQIWRDQHKHEARQSLLQLAGKPLSTSLTLLVLALAIALPLCVSVAVANIERWAGYSGNGLEITLFLKASNSAQQSQQLARDVARWDGVSSARYVSPQQALASLSSLAGSNDIASQLPENPLPGAVVMTLPHSETIETTAQGIATRARALKEVERLRMDLDWFRQAQALVALGGNINRALSTILAIAVVLVISNTIKFAVEARKQEIEVARLVGASNGYVRRPFLYMGIWIGATSAVLALLLVTGGMLALTTNIDIVEKAYSAQIHLRGLSFSSAIWVVLGTAGLGWIGAWSICNSYIRRFDPR
jgi:cell division transport system permease protein